jgi:hypothetical protein
MAVVKDFKSLFEDAAKESFKKYGFSNLKIVSDWKDIVGANLSSICYPEKIMFPPFKKTGGTLHLKVFNPSFSLELQSMESRIIEKISTYFGYQAIARIKISVAPRKFESKQKILTPSENFGKDEKISSKIEGINDPELRETLASLSQNIGEIKDATCR